MRGEGAVGPLVLPREEFCELQADLLAVERWVPQETPEVLRVWWGPEERYADFTWANPDVYSVRNGS